MGCEGRAESSGTAEKRGPDVFSLLVPQLQACRPGQGRRAVPTSSGSPGGGGEVGAGREEQQVISCE